MNREHLLRTRTGALTPHCNGSSTLQFCSRHKGIQMAIAIALTLVGLLLVSVTHYLGLSALSRYYARCGAELNLLQSMNALLVIFILHVIESLYFTAIYWVGHQWLDLGGFTSGFRGIFRDYFYFSLVSMTTLGLSEFNPVGHLKVITAMQSLLGFMMLTWSATFYFKALSKNN